MPWDRQRKLLILRSNVESSLPFENNKSIYLNKFNLLAFFVGSIRRISELYRSVLFAKWQLPDKESALESFFDLMAIALTTDHGSFQIPFLVQGYIPTTFSMNTNLFRKEFAQSLPT